MAFTPINAGLFGGKVAIALLEKRSPFQVEFDTPRADETCTPDHDPLEQKYGARDPRHDAVIDLGDNAVATTLLLFEHAVTADYSMEIEALRWRRKYPQLTVCITGSEDRPSFAATRPGAMTAHLAATVGRARHGNWSAAGCRTKGE